MQKRLLRTEKYKDETWSWDHLPRDVKHLILEFFSYNTDLKNLLAARLISKNFYHHINKHLFRSSIFVGVFKYSFRNANQHKIFNFVKYFYRNKDKHIKSASIEPEFDFYMSDDVTKYGKEYFYHAKTILSLNLPTEMIEQIHNTIRYEHPDDINNIHDLLIKKPESIYRLRNLSGFHFQPLITLLSNHPFPPHHKKDHLERQFTFMLLRNVSFKDTSLNASHIQKFYLCDLSNANFTNVTANKVCFSHSDLEKTVFNKANLIAAQFKNTNLSQADFSDANLENACFTHATLLNVNLSNANIKNIRLSHIKQSDLNTIQFIPDLKDNNIHAHILASLSYLHEQIKNNKYASNLQEAIAHNLLRCIDNLVIQEKFTLLDAKNMLQKILLENPIFMHRQLKDTKQMMGNAIQSGLRLFGKSNPQTPLFLSNSQKILDQAITKLNIQISTAKLGNRG